MIKVPEIIMFKTFIKGLPYKNFGVWIFVQSGLLAMERKKNDNVLLILATVKKMGIFLFKLAS